MTELDGGLSRCLRAGELRGKLATESESTEPENTEPENTESENTESEAADA
jgi:hypothetical protein